MDNSGMDNYFVYILKCDDGTFYTGVTNDLDRRIGLHNMGKGAKYTRGRAPVALVYSEKMVSRSSALSREYEIKTLSRGEKEYLCGLQGE